VPSEEDQPEKNLFFNAGTAATYPVSISATQLKSPRLNSYSWHPNTRGPQFFGLGSDGSTLAQRYARGRLIH